MVDPDPRSRERIIFQQRYVLPSFACVSPYAPTIKHQITEKILLMFTNKPTRKNVFFMFFIINCVLSKKKKTKPFDELKKIFSGIVRNKKL